MIELLLEAERALSFGRVDRAEQLYQQVARNDPRNSIAVVGLARVALERADDLGAYLLARRALVIDPENEAAQRLATRLEEVMRTRGEDVPATAEVPGWPPRPSVVPPSLAATALPGRPPAVSAEAVTAPTEEPPTAPTEAPPTAPTEAKSSDKRRTFLDRIRRR